MTMFVITIDTEPDNEWARPRVHTTENSRFVPRFQELSIRYGFKVTWLLTMEMAQDPVLTDYLLPRMRAGECEIGAHLHPWNTPPDVDLTEDDARHQPFPCEYPPEVQRQKLTTLMDTIERAYDERPVSYKAGRWGIDETHAGILNDLGIRSDTSICPGVDWGRVMGSPQGKGGPDFTRAPLIPYQPSPTDICVPGSMDLWEIPPTIVYSGMLGRYSQAIRRLYWSHRKVRRIFDRARLGVWWLRPYPTMTVKRLIRVAKLAQSYGVPVLNLTFHSSEMMPGGSPFNKTEEAIDNLYVRLEGLYAYLQSQGIEGATLEEARLRLAGEATT
jgi:hypothetical protein